MLHQPVEALGFSPLELFFGKQMSIEERDLEVGKMTEEEWIEMVTEARDGNGKWWENGWNPREKNRNLKNV